VKLIFISDGRLVLFQCFLLLEEAFAAPFVADPGLLQRMKTAIRFLSKSAIIRSYLHALLMVRVYRVESSISESFPQPGKLEEDPKEV